MLIIAIAIMLMALGPRLMIGFLAGLWLVRVVASLAARASGQEVPSSITVLRRYVSAGAPEPEDSPMRSASPPLTDAELQQLRRIEASLEAGELATDHQSPPSRRLVMAVWIGIGLCLVGFWGGLIMLLVLLL